MRRSTVSQLTADICVCWSQSTLLLWVWLHMIRCLPPSPWGLFLSLYTCITCESEIYQLSSMYIFHQISQAHPHWPEQLSGTSWIIASSGSTLIATVLLYPTDLLKTRLTVQHVQPSLAKYRGIIHATRTITREEGLRALYRGMMPSLLGKIKSAIW